MTQKKVAPILSVTLFLAILAGCGGAVDVQTSGTSTPDVQTSGTGVTDSQTSGAVSTPAQLLSISITPSNPTIAKNTSQEFTATGIYADNTTTDLTASVTWSSSDTNVSAFDNVTPTSSGTSMLSQTAPKSPSGKAYAYGKNAGTTTITATSGDTSGSTTLTVTNATLVSVTVTPANPSVARGTSQQFLATGTFSDNTTQDLTATATWSSSNTGVATINASGLASAIAAGSATVSATSGGISGSAGLTVTPATLASIAVTPANPSIAKGTTRQFTATGTFSDGTTQNLTASVSWSSSNTGVATIGASGLAASVAAGSTTIRASAGSISGSTTLTVTPATLMSVSITPANSSISQGATQQLTATGTYSDGTTQNLTTTVTWNSSNSGIATVSNAAGSQGLAAGASGGACTITAVSGTISANTTLTVTSGWAILSWDAPTLNIDGTPLTDLAGYYVYYGTSSNNYTNVIAVGNVLTYTINNLGRGTYYFSVTAYDTSGNVSPYSNETSKTIQ